MRAIKAVLFDFDDTLTKTRAVKTRQHQYVAKRYYGLELSEEDVNRHYGLPYEVFLRGLYGDADTVANLSKAYLSHSADYPLDLQEDALETLRELHELGLKLGIVTAVGMDVLQADMGRFDFPYENFVMIQCAEHSAKHKPDPAVFDPILAALAEVGVDKDYVMYVGDSLNDLYAARDAGLEFTGVTTGVVSADQFATAGAQNIVQRLSELVGLLGTK